jgi:hypothetical protein
MPIGDVKDVLTALRQAIFVSLPAGEPPYGIDNVTLEFCNNVIDALKDLGYEIHANNSVQTRSLSFTK